MNRHRWFPRTSLWQSEPRRQKRGLIIGQDRWCWVPNSAGMGRKFVQAVRVDLPAPSPWRVTVVRMRQKRWSDIRSRGW